MVLLDGINNFSSLNVFGNQQLLIKMSYLLTEIALEMLGYKFYDTNGVFHLINFQQSMSVSQSEAQTHPDEPSLMEYIDQPCDTESEKCKQEQTQPSAIPSSIQLRGTPVRALAKMMEYQTDKIQNSAEQQQKLSLQQQKPSPQQQKLSLQQQPRQMPSPLQPEKHTPLQTNQQSQQQQQTPQPGNQQLNRSDSLTELDTLLVSTKNATNARHTHGRALTNIMNYENCNIRNQIISRIENNLKRDGNVTKEEDLQECLQEELIKLTRDAEDMLQFRQFVEERLKSTDSRLFDTYLRALDTELELLY